MHNNYNVRLFQYFFFQAEDGIRDGHVTGVQTCALPIFLLGASVGMMVMYDSDVEPVIGNQLRLVGQLLGTGGGAVKVSGDTNEDERYDAYTQDVLEAESAAEQTVLASVLPKGNVLDDSLTDATGDARLAVYRLERDRNISRYLEQLQDLVAVWGEKSDPAVQAEIVRLLGRAERQMQAEGLLRVQGMNDAVVVLAESEAIVVVGGGIGRASCRGRVGHEEL